MDLKFKDNSKLKFDNLTRLEYIESTGTQYIDTGIQQNNITAFELIFTFKTSSDNVILGGITGNWNWNDSMLLIFYQDTIFAGSGNGSNKDFSDASLNTKYIIDFTNGNITINGSTKEISNFTKPVLLSVFKGGGKYGKCQLFSLKLYNGSAILRDFIPCITAHGTPGMYDTVSQSFFYNQGTGDFIAGPVVNSGIQETISLKTTTFYHKNTPKVNGLQLINSILDAQKTAGDVVLNRIRVDIGNASGSISKLLQYAGMAGFNDNYEPQAKPRLVGTYTINDWYAQEQLTAAQAAFDGLTIVPDPNYVIDFSQLAVQCLDSTMPNYNPAAAVYLQKEKKGNVLPEPLIQNGGRWFITYTQAAAITQIYFDAGNLDDTNNIAGNDYVAPSKLEFPELRYFGVTLVGPRNYGFLSLSIKTLWFPNHKCTYQSYQNGQPNIIYTYSNTLTIAEIRGYGLQELHYYGTWDEWASRDYTSRGSYKSVSNFAYNCNLVYFNDIQVSIATLSSTITKIGDYAFEGFKALSAVHIEALTPPTLGTAVFAGTSFKLYVGDGSSAEHDDAILADYLADTNWATYSSRLDTWYNYLHPSA